MKSLVILLLTLVTLAISSLAPRTAVATTTSLSSLINTARASAGLEPLAVNARLTVAAQKYSTVLAQCRCLSHTVGGSQLGDRLDAVGYNWYAAAENIASGFTTDTAVFQAWMQSPAHRANMLSPTYHDMGYGRTGNYWVLDLGAR